MEQHHDILNAYESAEPCNRLNLYLAHPTLRDQFIAADMKDSALAQAPALKNQKRTNVGWLDRLFIHCPRACDFPHIRG